MDSFSGERKVSSDISIFISSIEKCLSNNMFEDTIQNPADLLKSIISSGFTYSRRNPIEINVVKKFIDWFKVSTPQSQKMIISNLITKLSQISIDYKPYEDIPF